MKKHSVGVIGSGAMGKWHTYGYNRLNEFYADEISIDKAVICSRNIDTLNKKNESFGYRETVTDWREVVSRSDIDVIDISVPDSLHYPIAKAALENGKHIICEKPMAFDISQGQELCALAKKHNLRGVVVTNYRYFPAFKCIRSLLNNGKLGEIRHIYASFIMDWACNPSIGVFWRLDNTFCEAGVLGDLGTHLIDMCRFLGLEFNEVSAMSEVFTKQRLQGVRMIDVHCDELCAFTARFDNNAIGVFEVSRVSGGRGRSGMVFELHGTKGNAKWDMSHFNELSLTINDEYGENGVYQFVPVQEILKQVYPWSGSFVQSDSFTLLFHDFFKSITGSEIRYPTLEDGLAACIVEKAVLKSCREGTTVNCLKQVV